MPEGAPRLDHYTRFQDPHPGRYPSDGNRSTQRERFRVANRPAELTNRSLWNTLLRMNWTGWAILSAFFAGITAILAKVGVADVDSNLATAVRTTVVLLFTWSIALTTASAASLRQFSARTTAFLVFSGIATGLSWLCYFRALQLGPASRVAPVDKLSVVFAMALAAIMLGEHLSWQHYLGGGFIVAGAMILAWA